MNWRPPNLSELTPYQLSLGLTLLGSETFNYRVHKAKQDSKDNVEYLILTSILVLFAYDS